MINMVQGQQRTSGFNRMEDKVQAFSQAETIHHQKEQAHQHL